MSHARCVILLTLQTGNATTPLARLSWSCMDDPAWRLDEYSLKPLAPPSHHAVDADLVDYQDYALVVTGDVFRWMINNAPLETLQRVCYPLHPALRFAADNRTCRCLHDTRSLHGCPQMKRTRSLSGCSRLDIPSSCAGTVLTTVLPSKRRTWDYRYPRPRHLSQHHLQVKLLILVAYS